jgi:hypothetical protein
LTKKDLHLLERAAEKLVRFGKQVGATTREMILLLDSGISLAAEPSLSVIGFHKTAGPVQRRWWRYSKKGKREATDVASRFPFPLSDHSQLTTRQCFHAALP